MAEVSPISGFLIILKDSFKLIFKNLKFIAPITLLSLLLPSILILLFSYIYQTLNNYIKNIILSPHSDSSLPMIIAYTSLIFLVEFIFIMASFKISRISGIATILVSATSYTLSSDQDLCSRIKTAVSRSSSQFGFGGSKINRATQILLSIVLVVVFYMAFFYPNPITITIAVVVGISVSVFQMYDLVPMLLSHVVSVVEEKYERSEALERAEELLIEGSGHRQLHGFMINLLLNLIFLVILLGFWLHLGTKLWSLNLTELALFFFNFMYLAKMYGCVAYTVLYFRCNGGGIGEFDYSKLPAASDIP